jgi:hypothetical protein
MYLQKSKVKKKVKDLGFRSGRGFMQALTLAVDVLIVRSAEWTKPKKTITRDSLIGYLTKHGINL